MFCNKDLNKLISEHTNLYSVQKHGNSIATTDNEIKPFIGIQMLMSLVDLPSYMMDCVGKLGTHSCQCYAYKQVQKTWMVFTF